jgi:hypothetical protein
MSNYYRGAEHRYGIIAGSWLWIIGNFIAGIAVMVYANWNYKAVGLFLLGIDSWFVVCVLNDTFFHPRIKYSRYKEHKDDDVLYEKIDKAYKITGYIALASLIGLILNIAINLWISHNQSNLLLIVYHFDNKPLLFY